MKKWGPVACFALLVLACASAFGCIVVLPPPQPAGPPLTAPELKYVLIDKFPGLFYNDPDFYPIARAGAEEQRALEQFASIQANADEFSAILKRLGLPAKANYNGEEKLLIYREHKKLTYGVQLTATGGGYSFDLRIGETQGERIQGTITPYGQVTVIKREPSFNTHPICLSKGTLIDTPAGPLPVEQVQTGMTVWTVDASGARLAAAVVRTGLTPIAVSFEMVKVTLSDGRSVTASPGHPSAESRAMGGYREGDMLDGARVISVERVVYGGDATYDLLPGGPTGLYRANGILLESTLAGR